MVMKTLHFQSPKCGNYSSCTSILAFGCMESFLTKSIMTMLKPINWFHFRPTEMTNNTLKFYFINNFTLLHLMATFKMSYIFDPSKFKVCSWHLKRYHINFTGLQAHFMTSSLKPNKTNYCLKQKTDIRLSTFCFDISSKNYSFLNDSRDALSRYFLVLFVVIASLFILLEF